MSTNIQYTVLDLVQKELFHFPMVELVKMVELGMILVFLYMLLTGKITLILGEGITQGLDYKFYIIIDSTAFYLLILQKYISLK